jgi:hypothetical protein
LPPTTEEFKKLIALGDCLRGLAAEEAASGSAFLELLPGLRTVFGPAFPTAVHERLEAIESDLLSGRARPDVIRARASEISAELGIPFLAPEA